MADHTNHPDNNVDDALLMLYVADELSESERSAVDHRLAGDPALAQQLQQLRDSYVRSFAALAALDREQRLPTSEGVAVRRVTRAINQWQINRIVKPKPVPHRGLAMPWWSYPSAAVACMIVGFLVWSMHQTIGPLKADEEVQKQLQLADATNDSLADWLESGFTPHQDANPDLSDEQGDGRPPTADDLGVYISSPREDSTW